MTNADVAHTREWQRKPLAFTFCKHRTAYAALDCGGYMHTLWSDDGLEWHHDKPRVDRYGERSTALVRDTAIDYDEALAFVKASSSDTAIRLIVECCVAAHRPLAEGLSIINGAGV